MMCTCTSILLHVYIFSSAAPGLFFIVTQGQIRYKQLTESTLSDEFFGLLESPYMFLLDVGNGTNILGKYVYMYIYIHVQLNNILLSRIVMQEKYHVQ